MTLGELILDIVAKPDENSFQQAQNTVAGLKSALMKGLGLLGIGLSIRELISIADEFNQINDKIAYAVDETEDLKQVQDSIRESANNCKTTYREMADSVVSLKQANSEVFPIEKGVEFTECINKLGQSAGYSDREISAMMNSIQRMAVTGAMSAGDLTRIGRQAPALLETIKKGLDVDQEGLEQMAKSGKLTAETIRDAVLKSKDDINIAFDDLDYSISDAMTHIGNDWGFFVNDINDTYKITDTVARFMTRAFDVIMKGLNWARDGLAKLSDMLEGNENVLKLILAIAGAVFFALNAGKILGFLGGVIKFLIGIRISTLLAFGVFLLLFLIIEDIYQFMKGNKSVLGEAFKQAGIDADAMREKIRTIGSNIIKIFQGIWQGIQKAFAPALNLIKGLMEKVFGPDIFKGLGEGAAGVIELIERITTALANNQDALDTIGRLVVVFLGLGTAIKVVSGTMGFANGVIQNVILGYGVLGKTIWFVKAAAEVFGMVFAFITSPMGMVVLAIAGVIAAVLLLRAHWEQIQQVAINVWNTISSAVSTAVEVMASVIQGIVSFVISAFSNMLAGVSSLVGQIASTIINGLNSAIAFISSLPSMAFQWGADLIGGLINGITSRIGEVASVISGVGDTIRGFLHFSRPDYGPLREYEQWMPDFMEGLGQGIIKNKWKVTDAVRSLASDMQVMANTRVVAPTTAANVSGSTTNNRSVSQSVNINNTFNGDRAIQQKTANAMDKAAKDVSAELARGLAYAR